MKITIIGCGNMGKALTQRLSKTNEIFLYDRNREKSALLASQGVGTSFEEIQEAIAPSELIILAVKPQNMKEAAEAITSSLKGQTIVSLLAGTPIAVLKAHFPSSTIVRMMPNLAIIHGEGVVGLCSEESMKEEEKLKLSNAFTSLGKLYWIPESKMDALTALASSGPAFFYSMMEAMIESGIAMGFTAKDSQSLVHQMVQGSLTVLDKTDKHLAELKWQIASPGGTTIAGLKRMEELALKGNVINTFLAAFHRAQDLASNWEKE